MSFLEELSKGTNKTLTENGAVTNRSTLDPLLDFFSRAGAMRSNPSEAVRLFRLAFAADKQNAVRCLFYLRDVRGGQGEKAVPRTILSNLDEETAVAVLKYIPEYGRWDDIWYVPQTQKTRFEIAKLVGAQFNRDAEAMEAGKSVSLMAKWLPSENASSNETRQHASVLINMLNMKPRQYRKRVVELREYINLLEQLMSGKKWEDIDFSKIPSQAHRKHVKAFMRHQEERYKAYLESLKKGEKGVKINSGTLMTYEIFSKVNNYQTSETELETMEQMWKALPDYTDGKNALCVVDVSGSMQGLNWIGIKRSIEPMSVAVSLAIYFADRNKGPFANYFMTFESRSRLIKVEPNASLRDKFMTVMRSGVGGSTNIQSAFDEILNAAIKSKATPEEMPAALYILSDMEFDQSTSNNSETNFETAKRKFEEYGYKLPHLIFWNLEARRDNSPVTKYDKYCTVISGFNQSTFKHIVEGKDPMQSMLDILNSPRYAEITV